MAKKELNYTQIPNIVLDDTHLNVYEFRIIMHIARQTIGYGKKSDGISLSQFHKATGISVAKVHATITTLKEKKHIKVTQQTAKHGGKSYNRYSLTLIHSVDNHIHTMDNPIPQHGEPLIHDVDIQKKIEQKKIDKRETETIISNIFYSFTEHEKKRESNLYADYASMEAKSPASYKIKIKKQIEKQHKQTLEAFEDWYFQKTCTELMLKYVDKNIGEYTISSIYTYKDTKGYVDASEYEAKGIYFAQAKNSKNKSKVWSANSHKELAEILDLNIQMPDDEYDDE